MRDTYIPLFASTLMSSLWSLHGETIKVFLTLALQADPEGMVCASVDGLARVAGIPVSDTERHLATLEAPDKHSKDKTRAPTADGRRVERVPNGFRVLNLEWYREEARRQAELSRKRRWWNDKGSGARRDARRTETETETETILPKKEESPPTPIVFDAPIIKVNPQKGNTAPESLFVTDTQRLRCQELKMDPEELLRAFKLQEFNRDYSDWPRRFSKWIEDQKIRRETEKHRENVRKVLSYGKAPVVMDPSPKLLSYAKRFGVPILQLMADIVREGCVENLGKGRAEEILQARVRQYVRERKAS